MLVFGGPDNLNELNADCVLEMFVGDPNNVLFSYSTLIGG